MGREAGRRQGEQTSLHHEAHPCTVPPSYRYDPFSLYQPNTTAPFLSSAKKNTPVAASETSTPAPSICLHNKDHSARDGPTHTCLLHYSTPCMALCIRRINHASTRYVCVFMRCRLNITYAPQDRYRQRHRTTTSHSIAINTLNRIRRTYTIVLPLSLPK